VQRGRNDRGIALLTALLITALASTMAVSLVSKQQIEIRRTSNLIDGDRAYIFALGAETWVKTLLARDDDKKDSLDEDWAVVLPPIVVEGGQIAGQIEDMQGRFNINNLIIDGKRSDEDVLLFQSILEALSINPDLAIAIVDWMDKDQDPNFPNGAEDDVYMSQKIPYRAANQLMSSPSELLLVKGMTFEIYQQLAPFVSVLPERTTININTASATVLMALGEGISQADAEAFIELREETSFDNVDDFLKNDVVKSAKIKKEIISVNSGYFLLDAATRYGVRGKVRMFSLLSRKNKKVNLVMRAQGVY